MTKLENVDPLLTNRDDWDVPFEEVHNLSSQTETSGNMCWSNLMSQIGSDTFRFQVMYVCSTEGNPLRCVLLGKRLCSRHQRLSKA